MTKILNSISMNSIMMILILALILNSMTLNNKNIHPTYMGSILMIYSTILSLNFSMNFMNHWFSFIMFLTVISGLMILFMYFISFINNMKMMFKINSMFYILMLNFTMMLMMIIMMKMNKMDLMWFNLSETKSLEFTNSMNKNFMEINFMYSYNKNTPTLFSMIYLFISLTMIVKICLMKKYSIRKMN